MMLCPVCKSESKLVYKVTSQQVINHILTSNREQIDLKRNIEKIWGRKNATVNRCTNCKFVFSDPFIAANEELYSFLYSSSNYYPKWKWEYSETLNFLKKNISAFNTDETCLLELGAGNGAFIKIISPDIFQKSKILCTEYSSYGLKKISEYGVAATNKDLFNIDKTMIPKNGFNLILMFQILEHMDQIDLFFEKLNEVSSKESFLIISTPNYLQRSLYDKIKVYLDIPPIHISRWSKNSIELLAQKHGWNLISFITEKTSFIKNFKKLFSILYIKSSYSAYVNKIHNKLARKILNFGFLIYFLFRYFPFYLLFLFNNEGTSQLIILKKGN